MAVRPTEAVADEVERVSAPPPRVEVVDVQVAPGPPAVLIDHPQGVDHELFHVGRALLAYRDATRSRCRRRASRGRW